MTTKMRDCNQGRLTCCCLGNGDCSECSHGPARPLIKPQATKIISHEDGQHGEHHEVLRRIMRNNSPTGPVHMDGMMGRTFTAWFLIKCGLVGVVGAYLFDWAIMSMSV